MWDVEVELVEEWLLALSEDDYDLIVAALEVLQDEGPMLGRPLVDTIKGSRHKNMKELRPGPGADQRSGSCSRSIRNAGRSCWSPATRAATGTVGTSGTSRSPTNGSMTTSPP